MLNIKVFIQVAFDNKYIKSKDLVKKDIGDIFRRHPTEYNEVFDLENSLTDADRKEKLKGLFSLFIEPFTQKVLSKAGIKELAEKKEIMLLPAVEDELEKLRDKRKL